MPEVSVVIPTRNRSALLARTLTSVLRQSAVDLEAIVVDDCSTDDTITMLAGMRDRRIRLVQQQPRSGVSAARNRGVVEATGEWVAFLDDDDLWSPDKLLKQLRAAQAASSGWAYGGWASVTTDLTIMSVAVPAPPDVVRQQMPLRNMVPTGASNVLVHRSLLDQAGQFDIALRHLADWDMWIRLAQRSMPAAVSEPILAYVLHAGNASGDTDDAPREIMIVENRYRHLRTGEMVDRAAVYRWMAWHHLRTSQRRKALGAYARAVGYGDVKSVGRALVGLLWPGVVWRVRSSARDPGWDEAALWLSELKRDTRRREVARL